MSKSGKSLVYLDNAATMTKFSEAIAAESDFYLKVNANPLRGLYKNSVQASEAVCATRKKILEFFNADPDEYVVVFTRGTTEAINLIANGIICANDGFGVVNKKDLVLIDIESHHSNILPWKNKFENVKISTDVVEEDFTDIKVISLTAVSNVTGENFLERVKKVRLGAPEAILGIDAAQAAGHTTINIRDLGVDFMAFSGHKMGAPMSIGGLLIKKELAEKIRPMNFGGEMVDDVEYQDGVLDVDYAEVPERLEAGTMPVGAIVGLSAAIDKLNTIDIAGTEKEIASLVNYAKNGLEQIEGVEIFAAHGSILTFKINGVHPHDVAQILDEENVAVRAGYLCAQPFLEYMNWGPVVRASFSVFNTVDDADRLISAVNVVRKRMGF